MSATKRRLVQDDDEDDDKAHTVIDLVDSDEDDDVKPSSAVNTTKKSMSSTKPPKDELLEGLSSDEDFSPKKKKSPQKQQNKKKLKPALSDDDEDDDDFDEDDSEEDEKPKKTKKKTTVGKTRKGTTIEFTAGEGGGSLPRTKKEAAAAKKAAQTEAGSGFAIASNDPENPVRIVPADDPVAVKYNKMTLALLKDWLRANEMLLTGKKEDLVARCIDGEINGRFPRCERCKLGKIGFHPEKGVFTCGGYFDEDARMLIRCSFQEPTIKRLPWVDPETAAASKASEASAAEGSSSAAAGSELVTDEFVAEVTALNPREAADKLATFCKDTLKLSMPDDEKKVRLTIGPLLMSNRDEAGKFDVRKVIASLSTTYPPKTAESASAGGSSKPSGASCKVPANDPVAQLMDQLAIYEKKKGGENVQFKIAALKKAAIAIRGLDYEIKDGTAMGKPGKSKVEGIGKGTAKTIQEFLDSGKTSSPYLESLKAEVGE